MRVVFMGSPEFALPSLRALIDSEHDVVAVFAQPDRPAGRGRKLTPPPVKALAAERGLPVHQPASISKPESVDLMRQLAPDVGVIAAYGQILRQPVLDVPRLAVINVHASLLPRWRGASPISAAILAGDERAGATIMQVRLALDAGPMLARVEVPLLDADTTGTLTPRIAEAGAGLLMDVLTKLASGAITAEEQDESLVTYAPAIKKTDALIDWERDDATTIWRMVRAYHPWPVAYSYLDGTSLRIIECMPTESEAGGREPGTIFAPSGDDAGLRANVGFAVATTNGAVGIVRVQGTGGKEMAAAEYLRGHREIMGKRLTATPEKSS